MGTIYRQKGRHHWQLKYYRNGVPIYESSGTKDYDEAKRTLAKREGKIADGALLQRPGRLRFKDAAEAVVRDYRLNGKRTLADLERRLTLHLLPFFGDRRMIALTTPEIRAYTDQRLSEGATPASINRELAIVKRAFSLAMKDGTLVQKPHVPMLAERNVRTGFFERHDFEAVRKQLPADLRPLFTVAYVTGWRWQSELLPLQWRQVDREAGILRLDPGATKNDEGREFVFAPLPEVVETITNLWRQHQRLARTGRLVPHVFHRDGQPWRPTAVYRAWRAAATAAKVPGRLPHDLRRTAVRNLVRAGVSEKIAMLMTGHKTRSVFDRYDIARTEDLRQAAEKLATVTATVTAPARRRPAPRTKSRKA